MNLELIVLLGAFVVLGVGIIYDMCVTRIFSPKEQIIFLVLTVLCLCAGIFALII